MATPSAGRRKSIFFGSAVNRAVEGVGRLCTPTAGRLRTLVNIQVLSFIISWLLLLRIIVDIDFIEWVPYVKLFQLSTQLLIRLLKLSHEITKSIDTICRNIVCVTFTIIHLFLNHNAKLLDVAFLVLRDYQILV